jgi:hypothetical protein
MEYDPRDWLLSLQRSLESYVVGRFATVTPGVDLNEVYEIVWDYPTALSLPDPAEFTKTIIHFDIDDITTARLGHGTGIVQSAVTDGTDTDAGSVVDSEAMSHVVNYDVGVWASDLSGGVTSRLKAYQLLDKFLSGEIARQKCLIATQGVEIKFYRSGRFITEAINDVRTFRVVGAELEVRVFSLDDADPEILVDQEPTQEPELVIQGDDGSLVDLVDS